MLRRNQTDNIGWKNALSEVRNSPGRLNGQLDTTKERTNKCEEE